MRNKIFLFLSTTDWDAPQFGSRQQIALCLARRGHRILFVEVPRSLHSFISDPRGTGRAFSRLGQLREVSERLTVFAPPPVLPIYYNPLTNAINQRLLLGYIRRITARLGWDLDVVWTYWPNTDYLVRRIEKRIAIYHCIDDFTVVDYPLTTRRAITTMEEKLCRAVDMIFVRSEGLLAAKRRQNPNTFLLPGGVDLTLFDPSNTKPPPFEVESLPHPRIGVVGTIDDRIDLRIVAHCAAQLSDATFLMVGPIKRHRVNLSPLNNLSNIKLFPALSHEEVSSIIAALDVCLIPYRMNRATQELSPLKLYEYLAMGKPVVATDLPYVRREETLVRIADTPDRFVSAVKEAIDRPLQSHEKTARRIVAEAHSWDQQAETIDRLLAQIETLHE